MKFAKELEEDLVPEWRVKYFNYKLGKKKVKAVSRALRNTSRTPQPPGRPQFNTYHSNDELPYTHYDFTTRHQKPSAHLTPQPKALQSQAIDFAHPNARPDLRDRRESVTMFAQSPPELSLDSQSLNGDANGGKIHTHPVDTPTKPEPAQLDDDDDDSDVSSDDEEQPLQRSSTGNSVQRPRYGSIVGSPPDQSPGDNLSALELPDPALDPSQRRPAIGRSSSLRDDTLITSKMSQQSATPTDAPDYWNRKPPRKKLSVIPDLRKSLFKKSNDTVASRKKLKRAFTTLTLDSPTIGIGQFEAYRELDAKQDDFFNFLDKELNKVETFYKEKESEASSRLRVLREQLHEMRDRRLEDLRIAKRGGKIADKGLFDGQIPIMSTAFTHGHHGDHKHSFLKPVTDVFNTNGKIGKTSQAREELGSPRSSIKDVPRETNGKKPNQSNDRGDYVRKQQPHEKVPYRNAKRKLKLALQEFYRGLELLKSYALLNRTAFRKINKKYDKAVMARPPLRYMAEKVNTANFVQSTMVEETLVTIEDLYARYFERGNRKVAVNKLRSHLRAGEHSSVSFRNGLYVAAGMGFAVSGVLNGAKDLFSDREEVRVRSSYLFQLYGGYFLAVLLFLFFVLDCRVWTKARINYTFVFEYDTRHVLDWRQLAELPCFFLFLNGLFLWLNFQFEHEHVMHLYWPIMLIAITVAVIFLPFKILYYNARKWWLYSNWRLLLAGLYPVEFRDFYLGDMYCSEAYALSQLEVFFCVYGNHWVDPSRCNSNHSRVLGFLTTLPPIWRALQCIRRYYDSGNWFPHLANCAKYTINITYYMTLSLYRINQTSHMKALFIAFALTNGLYCSFWDVFMDFSLGNPWSKNFLLRDHLAFRHKSMYYSIMAIDVILRQQWIFYAIYTEDIKHAAFISFCVGLAEVIRRGLWSLFRVENEHCNNVEKFRASRDIPLPYSVPVSRAGSVDFTRKPDTDPLTGQPNETPGKATSSDSLSGNRNDLERADTATSKASNKSNLAKQSTPGIRALQRVSNVIAAAHSQDFTKKKRPEVMGTTPEHEQLMAGDDTDEDEDEDVHGYEERARRLDSREDLSPGSHAGDEDSRASGSGSREGSGSRAERLRSEREEREHVLNLADEVNVNEINEARDRIDRARH